MEDDDDVSLDTIFINYIMHMKENVTLIAPETGINYSKRSFIINFLSSIRQKIDDPLGKKRVKN